VLCIQEIVDRLLCKCNYTEAFWRVVSVNLDLPHYEAMSHLDGLVDRVILLSVSGNKLFKRKKLVNLFFFWWHVWKERNRRIFDNKERLVPSVANLLL
jgi:hypothetical protein